VSIFTAMGIQVTRSGKLQRLGRPTDKALGYNSKPTDLEISLVLFM